MQDVDTVDGGAAATDASICRSTAVVAAEVIGGTEV